MIEMIYIDGGTFQMGCGDGDSCEMPVHKVTLSGYWMSKFVVTNQAWNETFNLSPENDLFPRVNVSWIEAIAFCNKLSINEKLKPCYKIIDNDVFCDMNSNGYRLPTESEWEFAAIGGNKSSGFIYAGSNDADEVAWYEKNSDKFVHEVGLKEPNELGIYDLSGNVYEFCWDVFENYPVNEQINPAGPAKHKINLRRVLRGGNCFGFAYRVRSRSRRNGLYHQFTQDFVGIRLVRSCLAESHPGPFGAATEINVLVQRCVDTTSDKGN